MGLKDVVERLAGKKQTKQLGSRQSPEPKRRRDEATVQVPSPIGNTSPGARSAPPPAPNPSSSPPAAPRPSPPPAAPPPRDVPSPPPERPRASSAEATQYVTIPGVTEGVLVGVMVGIDGQLEGEIHKVFDHDMKIGRSQDCDIKLLDPKISREHARLVAVDGDLMIVPLTDKNPVFVNGNIVDEAEQIADGDKLQLGNPGTSVFRFRTIEGK